MHSAGRNHQIIVSNIAEIGVQQLLRRIDAVNLFHQYRMGRVAQLDLCSGDFDFEGYFFGDRSGSVIRRAPRWKVR